MPSDLIAKAVNAAPLSRTRLESLASGFATSLLSTAIRSVKCSHFPCALICVRKGNIAWRFQADCLVEGSLYPRPRKDFTSPPAKAQWDLFSSGKPTGDSSSVRADTWFQIFGDARDRDIWVQEEYIPIPVMETLLVLVSAHEDDVFPDD
jgi:hypothetical protein